MTTPMTDISRFLPEKSSETITITGMRDLRVGCMIRGYLVGKTQDGETVAVMPQGRSLLLDQLTNKRVGHEPTLTLSGCSPTGKPPSYRFPATFAVSTLYCTDAALADPRRQQAFERAKAEHTVGPRMDAIFKGGSKLERLLTQKEVAA